uniref:MATH domain-containing protein n=1 Tax=Ditylenchus dipsaci TaxID=166011 RepID=A0A915DXY7_9BILA
MDSLQSDTGSRSFDHFYLVWKLTVKTAVTKTLQSKHIELVSSAICIQSFGWKIRVTIYSFGQDQRFGVFLECCGVTGDPDWKCSASATLSVQSQKEGIPHFQRFISHEFCKAEDDWGFLKFCTVAVSFF